MPSQRMARRVMTCAVALLLGATYAGSANAHGIYIAPRAGSPTLVLGHGAEDLGYDADKVTELRAFDAQARELPMPREHVRRQFSFQLPAGAAAVGASYYGAFHGKTAEGTWKAGARGAHADVPRVGEYFKSTLFIAGSPTRWPLARLEIVPLQDVLKLHAGQTLAVRVSFDGKPLAAARVVGDYINASHTTGAMTDRNGVARITLRNQGLNVLAVTFEEGREDAQAHFREHLATLSFVLPYHDRH